jgi:hypothetical protein
MKKTNIIEEKQKVLQSLQSESANAIDMVTTTINRLSSVNEQIDVTIGEIEEAKSRLQCTEDDLSKTKEHNAKIINKFKALIE